MISSLPSHPPLRTPLLQRLGLSLHTGSNSCAVDTGPVILSGCVHTAPHGGAQELSSVLVVEITDILVLGFGVRRVTVLDWRKDGAKTGMHSVGARRNS